MADPSITVASDMQVMWDAFNRIHNSLANDPGVFGDACLTAVAAMSIKDAGFDPVQFTQLMCRMKELKKCI